MEKKRVSSITYLMLGLNWVSVLVVTGFISITTNNICDYYISRTFIENIRAIPWRPYHIMISAAILMGILTISFIVREFLYSDVTKIELGSLVFDFVISMCLVYLLNFNYNGILFWVFANVISHTRKSYGQYLFMMLAVISFVGTDFGLVSINLPLYNVQDYINYYPASTQSYLLGMYNFIISLNMVMFIIYCVLVIQRQRGTIEEVNELYDKLSLANKNLQEANTELHKYAIMKEKMGETKERNRLAREIHDTLGHTLTGISAGIDACIATIDIAPDSTKKQLEVISDVTREGINEIRRSVNQLRPDALERLSLEYAIRKMVKDTNNLTNTKVTFDCRVKPLHFDADEENAIYRVIQESVTNAIRHGNASEIQITMVRDEGDIRLTICDNGCGCEEITPGFGTEHIRERIQMLNGSVTFDGSNGFKVNVTIPIRWGEEYD